MSKEAISLKVVRGLLDGDVNGSNRLITFELVFYIQTFLE